MTHIEEIHQFIDWFYEENDELRELAHRFPNKFNSWYFDNTDDKFDSEWVKEH